MFVLFSKKAVNIRRSSLTHYQKVMNILRFSLSLQQSGEYSNVSASPLKVFAFRLQTSDEYSQVFSSLFQKVMNIQSFSLVHYQKVVNIRRFSFSSPNNDEYSKFVFEPQLLAWVGCSISLCLRPVGLFVCLFVYVFVLFYKTVLNIRRFSLAHYQQVVNIRRFSLSLQKSGEYAHVSASPL